MPILATSLSDHHVKKEATILQNRNGFLLFFLFSSLGTSGTFPLCIRRAAFLQQLKGKVGLALAKAADLRINLNIDGAPIASKSHTHPSHS
jgi:hypothetical protein